MRDSFDLPFPSFLNGTSIRRDTQLDLEVSATNHQSEVASGMTKLSRKAKCRI